MQPMKCTESIHIGLERGHFPSFELPTLPEIELKLKLSPSLKTISIQAKFKA